MMRIGQGYDVHKLEKGRDLWLGGVLIPHDSGCVGHSDADVLIHAICDALLGAAALRDIGYHFPDTDPTLKGIDSKILLKKTIDIVREQGYELSNIDSTISAQAPKLKPFIPDMQQTLSQILGVSLSQVSVKATTTEGLGFEGRQEGISALASVLIYKR